MATKVCESEICDDAAPSECASQKKGRLTIQCDEAWSFVGAKENKQRIWLAIDEATREIVGVYIGARSRTGAQGLWHMALATPGLSTVHGGVH